MANAFEKELGVPQPQCCSLGACCKGASPSVPFYELWEKAKNGEEFARGFFSIMVPHASHEEARKIVPGLVDRTIKAAKGSEKFTDIENDLVFYQCRYLENNRCSVHEDRPQFCRDYPDTPYVVMAPGCAFEGWQKECKSKMDQMRSDLAGLKQMKAELEELRKLQTERQSPSELD